MLRTWKFLSASCPHLSSWCYHLGAVYTRQISSCLRVRVGYGGWGSIKKRLESSSKALKTAEICISANPKFNFFLGKGGAPYSSPNSPVQRSWKASGKSDFSCLWMPLPTFTHLAPSLNGKFVGVIIWNCCIVSSSMSWNYHSVVSWVLRDVVRLCCMSDMGLIKQYRWSPQRLRVYHAAYKPSWEL